MTALSVRYSGLNKAKKPVHDTITVGNLAAWVEKRYSMGWRRLTVTDPDDPQHVLATIGPRAEGGGRTWWAEGSHV